MFYNYSFFFIFTVYNNATFLHMTEAFLQFVWQHQLFDHAVLQTTLHEPIEVIQIGSLHHDSGPDFFNAKIKIGNTIWAGDIEIHVKSSDWNKHKHQNQKAYNSVILHVVAEYDKPIITEHTNQIPTAILPIEKHIIENYSAIANTNSILKCAQIIPSIDTFHLNMWFDRLVIERFEEKAKRIIANLEANNNNWEETFYHALARNFGFKTNSHAFEELVKSLPLIILGKHKNTLLQIEALMFGQAGMTSKQFTEEYPQNLQKEYAFLQKKYTLSPIPIELWKFSRMRPANFPTIRIAEFAQLLHNSSSLTSKILEAKTLTEILQLFSSTLHTYWDNHFLLDEPTIVKKKQLGETSKQNLIINTVIPFLFAYGVFHSNEELKQRAVTFLEEIPSENNTIIAQWNTIDIQSYSGFRSQALLQLTNEYCNKGKCLQCAIGHKMMVRKIAL